MGKKKKMSKLKMRETRNGLLFITPWIFGFLVFTLYPIISSLYYSLCNYSVIKDPVFIGLENYKNLLHDQVFLKTVANTLYMICFGVPITTIIAVGVSVMLNNKALSSAYTGVIRVLFFLPTLIPTVVACLLWIWVMQPDSGIVNQLLGFLFREIPAGLHCVDEQLQLRQLKIPGGDVVSAALARDGHDVHTVILQRGNVGIDGFPVTGNAMAAFQHPRQFTGSHGMAPVGVSLQIIQNVNDFQLLIVGFGHRDTSGSRDWIRLLKRKYIIAYPEQLGNENLPF